jgi:hypothetical protein
LSVDLKMGFFFHCDFKVFFYFKYIKIIYFYFLLQQIKIIKKY